MGRYRVTLALSDCVTRTIFVVASNTEEAGEAALMQANRDNNLTGYDVRVIEVMQAD